jgi:hypothetical protein
MQFKAKCARHNAICASQNALRACYNAKCNSKNPRCTSQKAQCNVRRQDVIFALIPFHTQQSFGQDITVDLIELNLNHHLTLTLQVPNKVNLAKFAKTFSFIYGFDLYSDTRTSMIKPVC